MSKPVRHSRLHRRIARLALSLVVGLLAASVAGGLTIHWYHKGKLEKWGVEGTSYWMDAPAPLNESTMMSKSSCWLWDITGVRWYPPERRGHYEEWKAVYRDSEPAWPGVFPAWVVDDINKGSHRSERGSVGLLIPMWEWHRFDYELFSPVTAEDGLGRVLGVPIALRPRFPGVMLLVLGLSVIAYVGIWFIERIALLIGSRIAFVRRRWGKCGRCGYDLAGIPGGVCPECGEG